MEYGNMSISAVIVDIYNTVLAVGVPPADAEARWAAIWHKIMGAAPRVTRAQFNEEAMEIVAAEHALARAQGVAHPEVFWPEVVCGIVPELGKLSAESREGFLFQEAQLRHTLSLMPGATECLRMLHERGISLGIASNSQPYTLQELDAFLASAGLSRDIFAPDLCFFSFEQGFSKPDPHVFRFLTARLRTRGIAAGQILMVGNRADNDIAPAAAQGWQTWHLTPQPSTLIAHEGDWHQLIKWLLGALR
jgi:FMN phosphatase YigB (HAD superfamily)